MASQPPPSQHPQQEEIQQQQSHHQIPVRHPQQPPPSGGGSTVTPSNAGKPPPTVPAIPEISEGEKREILRIARTHGALQELLDKNAKLLFEGMDLLKKGKIKHITDCETLSSQMRISNLLYKAIQKNSGRAQQQQAATRRPNDQHPASTVPTTAPTAQPTTAQPTTAPTAQPTTVTSVAPTRQPNPPPQQQQQQQQQHSQEDPMIIATKSAGAPLSPSHYPSTGSSNVQFTTVHPFGSSDRLSPTTLNTDPANLPTQPRRGDGHATSHLPRSHTQPHPSMRYSSENSQQLSPHPYPTDPNSTQHVSASQQYPQQSLPQHQHQHQLQHQSQQHGSRNSSSFSHQKHYPPPPTAAQKQATPQQPPQQQQQQHMPDHIQYAQQLLQNTKQQQRVQTTTPQRQQTQQSSGSPAPFSQEDLDDWLGDSYTPPSAPAETRPPDPRKLSSETPIVWHSMSGKGSLQKRKRSPSPNEPNKREKEK